MFIDTDLAPESADSEHQLFLEQCIALTVLLGQHGDFDEMIRLASTTALTLFHAESVSFVMLNPQTHQTQKTIAHVAAGKGDRKLHLIHTNVIGWTMKERKSFITEDISKDPRFSTSLFRTLPYRSALCVPVRLAGSTLGHIVVLADEHGPRYGEHQCADVEQFAAVCAPFLGNTQALTKRFSTAMPDEVMVAAFEPLGLIGTSERYCLLLRAISAASQCDVRVFIEGESGTGKELVARAIHSTSQRSGQHFVGIDCGAIPPQLVESELFGHVKGAFTGATANRRGVFDEADGGTLFLDEVTNLSFDMQAKLLRVLQEGEVKPVGANHAHRVNVRIIAATSSPVWPLVEQKRFRDDLYYRLHVFPIRVPSLHERAEDIPLLANHFVRRFADQQHKIITSIEPALIRFMRHRRWRGNIRELENFIERMVTLTPSNVSVIDHDILPQELMKEFQIARRSSEETPFRPLNDMLSEVEEQRIREALERFQWNQSEAARALHISERSMRYKMIRLGIVKAD